VREAIKVHTLYFLPINERCMADLDIRKENPKAISQVLDQFDVQ